VRQLIVLTAGVLLIVGAWWVTNKVAGQPPEPAKLALPPDQADKPALIRSAQQLYWARPGVFDPLDVIAFLRRLNESLDDNQWRAVSAVAFFAWENQRASVPTRVALSKLNETLLRRFARCGSISDLIGLVNHANENAFDGVPINSVLDELTDDAVGKAGYDEMRLSELIAATVFVRDLKRAKGYLGKVKWEPEAPPEAKATVELWTAAVNLCESAERGLVDLPPTVRTWHSMGAFALGRSVFRPVLEEIALRLLDTWEGRGDKPKLDEIFSSSAAEVGGEGYWNRIVERYGPSCITASGAKVDNLATLAAAYGSRFKKPAYAYQVWNKAAEANAKSSPQEPLRTVEFLERAFVAAPDDARRTETLKEISRLTLKAKEYERARKRIEAGMSSVSDPEFKEKLADLLSDVKKKVAEDNRRVDQYQKDVDLDRRRGRLKIMREYLAKAQKDKRSPEAIRNIEEKIRELEKDVTE